MLLTMSQMRNFNLIAHPWDGSSELNYQNWWWTNVHPFKKNTAIAWFQSYVVSSPIFYHGFWGLFQQLSHVKPLCLIVKYILHYKHSHCINDVIIPYSHHADSGGCLRPEQGMGIDRCTEFFQSFGPQVCTESLEQGIRFLAMEFDDCLLESLDCFGGKMTGSPYIWWGQPWFPIAIRCSKLDIVAQHHGIFRLWFSHISFCFLVRAHDLKFSQANLVRSRSCCPGLSMAGDSSTKGTIGDSIGWYVGRYWMSKLSSYIYIYHGLYTMYIPG